MRGGGGGREEEGGESDCVFFETVALYTLSLIPTCTCRYLLVLAPTCVLKSARVLRTVIVYHTKIEGR